MILKINRKREKGKMENNHLICRMKYEGGNKEDKKEDPATTGGDTPKKPGMVGKLSILQLVIIFIVILILIVIISLCCSAWKHKNMKTTNELKKQDILFKRKQIPSSKSTTRTIPIEMKDIHVNELVPDMMFSPRMDQLPNVPALTPRRTEFFPPSQPEMFDITNILSPRIATMPQGYNFISNAFPLNKRKL